MDSHNVKIDFLLTLFPDLFKSIFFRLGAFYGCGGLNLKNKYFYFNNERSIFSNIHLSTKYENKAIEGKNKEWKKYKIIKCICKCK